MQKITGLIGRDDLVAQIVKEIKKGKHVVLTGAVGIGKSAVLEAALKTIEPRQSEWRQFDLVTDEAGDADDDLVAISDTPGRSGLVLVYLSDHQAKGQFVQMARRLMETGILKPSSIDLAKQLDGLPPGDIEWTGIRRQVNRMSIRDLSSAIISAIYAYQGKVLIAVDDMTQLTPTQQAFWLAIFDHAQVVTCASQRKAGLRKLWWKMKEIGIPPPLDVAKSIVREYIARRGMMIESPELYVGHVVKQAGGNPQAIHDMVDESSKERLVDKRRIREMRHQAGVRYVDFTPAMIVVGAMVVATRYVALGIGDRSLYVMAGIGAALFLSIRFFMFKGAGKANQ